SFIGAGLRSRRPPSPASDGPVHPEAREVRFPQDARYYKVPPQNRAAMVSRKSFAGLPGGNRPQDSAVQGVNAKRRTYNRATEHLVAADAACQRFRRLLLESLERLESGRPPLGLGEGYDFRSIQGYSGSADVDAGWEDLVPGNTCRGPLPIRQQAPARV
ncbi:MAG: hypothetical protein J2O38_03525, partial [Acidimicrobiales bacterium]|nr:hypothetical protein [Acidimicrobiales bacterium]